MGIPRNSHHGFFFALYYEDPCGLRFPGLENLNITSMVQFRPSSQCISSFYQNIYYTLQLTDTQYLWNPQCVDVSKKLTTIATENGHRSTGFFPFQKVDLSIVM